MNMKIKIKTVSKNGDKLDQKTETVDIKEDIALNLENMNYILYYGNELLRVDYPYVSFESMDFSSRIKIYENDGSEDNAHLLIKSADNYIEDLKHSGSSNILEISNLQNAIDTVRSLQL